MRASGKRRPAASRWLHCERKRNVDGLRAWVQHRNAEWDRGADPRTTVVCQEPMCNRASADVSGGTCWLKRHWPRGCFSIERGQSAGRDGGRSDECPGCDSHRRFALAAAVTTAGCSQSAETPAWKTLPKPAALPAPDESGLAPVDDIKMWYAIFNKGGPNPVLLIHGGLVNADTWGNQVPVLAKTHEVIIADSRGHGRSTRSNKPFGYELMADDYLALLDFLKIEKVALVGWSDGGIIGLDIAVRHPERLTKLWMFGANTHRHGTERSFRQRPGLRRRHRGGWREL